MLILDEKLNVNRTQILNVKLNFKLLKKLIFKFQIIFLKSYFNVYKCFYLREINVQFKYKKKEFYHKIKPISKIARLKTKIDFFHF